jgi:Tfp pilus assembly protein PilF
MTTGFKKRQVLFLISAALVVATLVAYEPMRHNDFVMYDDPSYVMENPNVKGGITLQSIIWAFIKSHSANWHPITWLSHMLDCEIYGLNPLGHHITSLLIHIVNTLLLFFLLLKMTDAVWPSAFVAAAFALHPIHVESVAWVAERKDVLSGLFWMLTILAYVRYAKRPNVGRYVLVLLAFIMGLMSKPMVVTLPFVLLLLDYWPLDRYRKAPVWQLVAEKVPLLVLSATSSIITFIVQKHSEAVVSLMSWPLPFRVINALGCYFNYIVKMLYPKDLAVLYPAPQRMTIDAAVLAAVSVVVLLALWGHGRRWLVVGLLWYLGMLVPVIGLVQVGEQIMADRYTYLPSIGIFLIIAWGAEEIFSKMRYSRAILSSGAAAALIAMVLVARIQAGYWRDSTTLFERAIAVTRNNYIIHNNYGSYLCTQGRYEEGIRHFREATSIYPEFLLARKNLCVALSAQNKLDEAITCLTEALRERNDWPNIHQMHYELGWAYERKGNLALAEINYRKALTLKPDYEPARNNLASLLVKQNSPQPPKTNANLQLP